VALSSAGYLISRRLRHPLLNSMFHLPVKQDIDLALVAGAAIFGVGWGMSGLCPGPAIASLAWTVPSCVFAATMLAVFGLGAKATVGRQPESRRDRQCLNRLPFMQASFGNLFDAAQAIGAKKLSPASSIRPM
jgi:uncharacterized membrane protein YedE/YeeE